MRGSPEQRLKEAIAKWGSILTVVILSGICMLSLVLNYRFASASQRVLDVSIQTNRLANYSVDPISSPMPVLKIQIIKDVIEDQEPTNVLERVEAVQEHLQTSVPTVTPTPPRTNTPIPGVGELTLTVQTGPTKSPQSTSTPPSGRTAPVTSTSTSPGFTATVVETGTATNRLTQTSTRAPISTPTATKRVGKPPTPTSEPSKTPPPVPTATKTLPPPPTATRTATNTPPPPPTATKTATRTLPPPPTATKTATKTLPPPPTATKTPTKECYPPDPGTGFISSTVPNDGAMGVPLDISVIIEFNQAMYIPDLFKNIKVSGTKVDYVMSYDRETHQVEIDFLRLLERGTKVTVEIKRSVKNSCQQRQNVSVKFEFITVGK